MGGFGPPFFYTGEKVKKTILAALLVFSLVPKVLAEDCDPCPYDGSYEFVAEHPNTHGDPHNTLLLPDIYGPKVEPYILEGVFPEFDMIDKFSFNWNFTDPNWLLVGFGIKAGPTNYYYELTPYADLPSYGTFIFEDSKKAISHIDSYGIRAVTEPSTLILFMLGVMWCAYRKFRPNIL